ncbi:putative ubiquitin carboxyl-terminal hydrolase 2 [Pseudocercospora fuligena]|uniref:ubiquitinyl hydrolase 1 n=1 Tax=Pseudocercospora fuligena TaxID=685502 RepID=A0A8H6VI21_9PEZI|nr:putative ubiquitin carboxyl-terminal hydrolase 2 [Pseudocercospora fuligena]
MSQGAEGPGKTAPKLKHDFSLFDPIHCSSNSNYLADFTPPHGEGRQLAPDSGSCKHEYTLKSTQSVLPPLDLRPDGGDEYRAAVVCKKCRIHADMHIAFPHATNPCPNSDYDLHHFQRASGADVRLSDKIAYGWQCSAPECRAILRITYRLPRLQPAEKDLLTNTEYLKQRYEALMKDDPNREGLRQATPIDALNRLRRYIKDSLAADRTRTSFPANNKRFQEAFGLYGRDCYGLLQKLGFTYAEAKGDEMAQWCLPNPTDIGSRLQADGSSSRELLEDCEAELLALIYKLAAENPSLVNPAAAEGWPLADRDIERVLAAQGYTRYSSLRRAQVSNEEIPFYASLGALPDFGDKLIEFCFDRQCLCDPQRRPYYFECLQVITDSRTNSESLQLKVATMSSQDLISRRDLSAAYRYLDIEQGDHVDEERIVNLFHSRQSDLGKQAQEEARQALYKIGISRGSQRLINASKQTLETYDDALTWLGNGVNKDTPDESLLAVVATKTTDNAENMEMAQKAISVIARERKSDTLNEWLLKDGENTMGVEEALRIIGVEDKWDNIDKTVLPMMFDGARIDRPGEQTEKAIKTLEQALAGNIPTSKHSPETWPVGLTSHGNTCYLNSLLQYYFSIKPLRDIVFNYDDYKLDTAVRARKEERVGQRVISETEISGGQRFVEDLKELFERMIKDPAEHVKPSEDLVCRTFLEPEEYALLNGKEVTTAPSINGSADTSAIDDKAELSASANSTEQRSAADSNHQGAADDSDTDVKMKEVAATLTPPASPKEQPSDLPPLPPRPAPRRFSTTREVALEKAQETARQQQDVTEAHDLIMFRLRAGMTPKGKDTRGEQIDSVAQLFKITLASTSVKDGEVSKSDPEYDNSITTLVPNETTDIYNLLDQVFDLQPSGSAGVDVYKSLATIPPLFQVNIPRINWDKSTGTTSKSEACVKLPDELYLDRYCDDANEQVLPRRKACWGWRRQLHALRKEQQSLTRTSLDLDGPTAVSESAKFLNAIDESNADLEALGLGAINVDARLSDALSEDALEQRQKVTALDKEIAELESRLRGNFDEMKNIKYRLAAVFIHRGNTGHGHYWLYIHDFENDIWRSYNDERVEEFTKLNEMYEAKNWNHGTPTYAVYVVDKHKAEIISPVCRAPEKAPSPQSNGWQKDEIMGDGTDDRPPPLESVDPEQPAQIGVDPTMRGESNGDWDKQRQVAGNGKW